MGSDVKKRKGLEEGTGNSVVDAVEDRRDTAVVDSKELVVDTVEGMKEQDFEYNLDSEEEDKRNSLEFERIPFQLEHLPSYFPSSFEVLDESLQ